MFRASVHTSFVQDNVIRLYRDELDGACKNKAYPSDFFIDLIFTDARNQSNLILAGITTAHSGKATSRLLDFEEEEKKLMQGSKNLENKDDFWITVSQEL